MIYPAFVSPGWFFQAAFRYSGSVEEEPFQDLQATPLEGREHR